MILFQKYIKPLLKSPYFILLTIAVVAYWQIAFLTNSVQWDMLDCYLPWRNFISDTIQNGQFPLWNPYQQLGYPIHADLRSVWNPFVLFVSLFGTYTNYTLHFFLIFYLFLAGTGMYKLIMHFTENKNVSLLIAITYILSGFFISHTQEISAYAGGAFIPFTLYNYLKFFKNLRFIEILKTCLFLFLMLTTVYPAITIILSYLLVLIFFYHFIPTLIKWNKKHLIRIITAHIFLIVIIVAFSSVFIITMQQAAPYVNRITGLTIEGAQYGAFTIFSSISFFFPFATVKDPDFFQTDLTMSNAYFGIIILVFFISSLFKKQSGFNYFLLAFGVIALLASMGDATPVRMILYDYVPLMNKFRFPSFFTIFSIIAFLIFAGNFLSTLEKEKIYKYKPFLYVALAVLSVCIYTLLYSSTKLSISHITFFNSDIEFWDKIKTSTRLEHLFIHSVIQTLIITVLVIYLIKNKLLKFRFLFWIIAIEMIISVQLNMYYTGINKANPKEINNYVNSCQKGFVIPENNNISENTDKKSSHWPLWRNTSIFSKEVSFDSFNSFVLKGYEDLINIYPQLQDKMINNPLLYFSDKVLPNSDIEYTSPQNSYIFVDDSIIHKLRNLELKKDKNDEIEIIECTPNKIIANTKTRNQQIITLLQNNYYG